ncbi:hypothetical protein F5Y19DRAFT_213465 [Xylariaceae sp. FL1651]|nr:hypothetical protein F5Y19DRAFT_213465 [Xylariaceae sp. FL1651]
MPSRRGLPKLSLFSSRHITSSFASVLSPSPPASPSKRSSTSSTPITPPARLHLRNILPASPEEPALMPPPPRTPRAWIWQCHRCLNVYRLGCTRRCLDCSHTYCVSADPKSERTSRGKKRRRPAGTCITEFDYSGWEQWGCWRRKVLGFEAVGRCKPNARDRAFIQKRHSCWIDCDSPSQCHHRSYELVAKALKEQDYSPGAENESHSPTIMASVPLSPDDELPLNEAIELREGYGDGDEEKSPKSPLSQSNFFWDEPEQRKMRSDEEKVWWAAGTSSEQRGIGNSTQKFFDLPLEDNQDSVGTLGRCAAESRPVSRLTVRSLTDKDVWEDLDLDSNSDSELDETGWSSASEDSNDSSLTVEAGVK